MVGSSNENNWTITNQEAILNINYYYYILFQTRKSIFATFIINYNIPIYNLYSENKVGKLIKMNYTIG